MTKTIAPFGSWQSPISAERVAGASLGLSEPQFDGADIYWLESRPQEKGRSVIVKRGADGTCRDVLPAPLNARSRVNEYGGGSYCVHESIIYFVQFDDQRIYRLDPARSKPRPEALTPENRCRYGDLTVDPHHRRLLAVCEDHSGDGEPATYLVSVDLKPGDQAPRVLAADHDFFASPRPSPDGSQLCWLAWDHPLMPWDGCVCYLAELDKDGQPQNIRPVAGGPEESLAQPQWSPDGVLYLVSDRNNWWNLYRVDDHGLRPVLEKDAEFAGPQWVFGLSTYGFLDRRTLLATYTQYGHWHLVTINLDTGSALPVHTDQTEIGYLHAQNGEGIFIGASGAQFPGVYRYRGGIVETLTLADELPGSGMPPADIAQARTVEFPGADGHSLARAYFYAPTNSAFTGPPDQRPPLLVLCHGGPTSAARHGLNFKIQYWTSRGFAVADVNYAGSTGFGRDYRERLAGQWGVADVCDAVACVRYLAAEGLIDPDRAAIRGSSAGGYTVLSALTFTDTFKAGASYYGIGDLETLVRDTHKFESRYLDKLVGPYPEQQAVYRERSPIHYAEQLTCPVIFLQGLKDKVVPPNQAEAMVEALADKGLPVAYVTFPDEGHGFRQAANIRRALESELYFYSRVFGFEPADAPPAVRIRNLEA